MQQATWCVAYTKEHMKKQEEMMEQDTSCIEQEPLHNNTSTSIAKAKRSSSKSGLRLRRLSQAEMNAHWPFTRLDPRLFPKNLKTTSFPTEEEEALL